MTNPKPRSYFLPIMLLVVGLVICVGVVLVFMPVVECHNCFGLGTLTAEDLAAYLVPKFQVDGNRITISQGYTCEVCLGKGKLPLYQKWVSEQPFRSSSLH